MTNNNRIDWKNHLIAFVATLIGILVGLNLDERQNDKQTTERLSEFIILIDQEINDNVNRLDSFLNLNYQNEVLVRFLVERRFENGILIAKISEMDSLKKIHPLIQGLVFECKDIGHDKLKLEIGSIPNTFSLRNTVWESFKTTDLINKLKTKEIARYSMIYGLLESVKDQGHFNESSNLIIEYLNSQPDDELPADFLKQLLKLHSQVNQMVDRNLFRLKSEIAQTHVSKYPVVFKRHKNDIF